MKLATVCSGRCGSCAASYQLPSWMSQKRAPLARIRMHGWGSSSFGSTFGSLSSSPSSFGSMWFLAMEWAQTWVNGLITCKMACRASSSARPAVARHSYGAWFKTWFKICSEFPCHFSSLFADYVIKCYKWVNALVPPTPLLGQSGKKAWPILSVCRCWQRPASFKLFEVWSFNGVKGLQGWLNTAT